MFDRNNVYDAVARNLREFGYPDASRQIVQDVDIALRNGIDIPHGIIGTFAADQLKEFPVGSAGLRGNQ